MVLDRHDQPPFTSNEAWTRCDRLTFQDAIKLEPQIVVEPARGVLLHDEGPSGYCVSHSLSFVQRRFALPPRTAMPIALRWPISTTSRLPRVTPV
ncbi:hypothetical protein AFCDBAGC_5115 [Methylobacterium cerastii]|uniref:Uncharacterized protein n=1 Tax=Methylobacterium cerastii TaxID=932741 RepID=A0ABQ4QPK2_9HYPH|nr:hypothetical protein AFCDBAGC_5115 [Methylobacterium cerastii]